MKFWWLLPIILSVVIQVNKIYDIYGIFENLSALWLGLFDEDFVARINQLNRGNRNTAAHR